MARSRQGPKPRGPKQEPQHGRKAPPEGESRRWVPSHGAVREIVESVAIAFILAFLIRTFEAEAFVIPTGSMASTLMGRHKDLVCPMCGTEFQASASEEVDANNNRSRGVEVVSATCPNCRYTLDLTAEARRGKDTSSF